MRYHRAPFLFGIHTGITLTMNINEKQWAITVTYFIALVSACSCLQAQTFKVFFGDLHQHSTLSVDAFSSALPPIEAFDYAKQSTNLDFMAITDHTDLQNDGLDLSEWQVLLDAATAATNTGFIGLGSQEVGLVFGSGGYGHVAIHDSPDLADNDVIPGVRFNLNELYNFVISREALAHFCHPSISGDQSSRFNNFAFVPEADPFMFGVEVLSGFRSTLYEWLYLRALENGWHVGAVTGQDNHGRNYGDRVDATGNINLTGVLLDTLSRANLLDAFKNRRTYAFQTSPASDRMFLNEFTADGHWMGEIYDNDDNIVNFTVSAEAQGKFILAQLYKNGVFIKGFEPNAQQFTWSPSDSASFGSVYYFVKLVQEDRDVLWSSPIWANSSGQYLPPENRITRISELRANLANGLPRNLERTNVTIRGIATAGREFGSRGPGFLQDSTGAIAIFGASFIEKTIPNFPLEFEVIGKVSFFNGQTEITPYVTKRLGLGSSPQPQPVTSGEIAANGETYEGQLVKIANAQITGSFPPSGVSANITIDDGSGPCALRIDGDTNIAGTSTPAGKVNVVGIVTQFDSTPPYDSGYQILPRSLDDFDLVTSVEDPDSETTPKQFSLRQNYPNPFNPETEIIYTVPKTAPISLKIYNVTGQLIRTLLEEVSPAGEFSVIWNGTNEIGQPVASGVYLYKLKAPDWTLSRKLILMR
ncbi:T9SS type A sorting domain-containing protein [bacterium]|nr:T9SS type A sorting domain-containing protein [bacterium]